MAEVEIIITEEVKHLKNEIKALRKKLDKPDMAKEELLTFNMLDRHQHIVQQQAWPWQWEHVDTLYTLTDCIPTWVVDDTITAVWASGKQGPPNSFVNWDSSEKVAGMVLMLSRGPCCLGVGTDLEGEKVYSAVVAFVHPRQELLTIKEGADCLVATVKQSGSSSSLDVTVLCELPSHKHGRFYPSPINHAYLVLPYLAKKGKPKETSFGSGDVLQPPPRGLSVAPMAGKILVTWRSCHLCSPGTPPPRSCFQLGTSVNCG